MPYICYILEDEATPKLFRKWQQKLLSIPGIVSEKVMIDVDSSIIQIFQLNDKKIKLVNDTQFSDTSIESELDLTTIIEIKSIRTTYWEDHKHCITEEEYRRLTASK